MRMVQDFLLLLLEPAAAWAAVGCHEFLIGPGIVLPVARSGCKVPDSLLHGSCLYSAGVCPAAAASTYNNYNK